MKTKEKEDNEDKQLILEQIYNSEDVILALKVNNGNKLLQIAARLQEEKK